MNLILLASAFLISTPDLFCKPAKPISKARTYKFILPNLNYDYAALEPYIDRKTMEVHYTKHHKTYVENLNKAIEKHPELHNYSLENLLENLERLPADIGDSVRHNAGGHYNHSLFWEILTPNSNKKPKGKIAKAINQKFGSFAKFKEIFSKAAKELFGSGWIWLCIDDNKELKLVSTKDQDCPISNGLTPILCLDVWEHAYYLKYQNKRIDYITAWWNIINWPFVEEIYLDSI